MNYYVFRINYGSCYEFIREKALNGELRQGWGAEGMSVVEPCEAFMEAWHNVWGMDDANGRYIIRKYNNIRTMLEIEPGDIIIIPKLSMNSKNDMQSFLIAECKGKYSFSPINNDFGHIINIKPIASCPYAHNSYSHTVAAKFKSYRKAVNKVYSESFIESVDALIGEYLCNKENFQTADYSNIKKLSAPTSDAQKQYYKSILDTINNWDSSILEKIIVELFEKNGYVITGRNQYDGKGGDIDIVLNSFVPNTLMADVFSFSKDLHSPEVRIQAKKKSGEKDENDIEGVKQLIQMKKYDHSENAINILISTIESFNEETKEMAAKENIILIGGYEFASLLVKYGIEFIDNV